VVGHGHVLTGTVRSRRDCAPVAGARVELWPEIAGQGHPDSQRATVITGADGRYRFESDPPEHIHMLVSASGFEPLASNRYHPEGRTAGRFDVVLTPARS
jgi:protocatechuate 3,4-dioxygenase beta subunit